MRISSTRPHQNEKPYQRTETARARRVRRVERERERETREGDRSREANTQPHQAETPHIRKMDERGCRGQFIPFSDPHFSSLHVFPVELRPFSSSQTLPFSPHSLGLPHLESFCLCLFCFSLIASAFLSHFIHHFTFTRYSGTSILHGSTFADSLF